MASAEQVEQVEEENLNEPDELLSSLLNAFKTMRENEKWTDVVLVCNGGEIQAHQMILAAQSPYFKKLFNNDLKESTTKHVNFSHVKKDIMLLILDYIYLNSLENISDENVESLINIYQVSHLFEIKRLSESCRKLIMNRIDVDNWIKIWELILRHGNNNEISQILNFILTSLSEIVERNFLLLNYSQLMTLMHKINQFHFRMEDKFLEAVIQWIRTTKEKKVHSREIFLQINFDFISREFMINLMEKEKDLFEESLDNFLKLNVLPKLKKSSEIESLKKPSASILTKNKPVRPILFFFGWYRKEVNGRLLYDVLSLRIFDCEKKSVCKIINNLPFRCSYGINPIQYGSDIYILGGCIPSGNYNLVSVATTTSFFLYDWKNNKVVVKPSLLKQVSDPLICVTENTIYVFDSINNEATVQYFCLSEQKWYSETYDFYPVACASVNNVTYLLCSRENNSGYYDLFTVNQLKFYFHSKTPVPYVSKDPLQHVYQGLLFVYKDKIWVFSENYKYLGYSWFVFDPKTQDWSFTRIHNLPVFKTGIMNMGALQFFPNTNKCIMVYNEDDHSLHEFYENSSKIKVMIIDGPLDEHFLTDYDCVKDEIMFVFQSSSNV